MSPKVYIVAFTAGWNLMYCTCHYLQLAGSPCRSKRFWYSP